MPGETDRPRGFAPAHRAIMCAELIAAAALMLSIAVTVVSIGIARACPAPAAIGAAVHETQASPAR